MPSRWDAATHGWSRRVFHYPLPTLMSRNFRLPCTIELQPLSHTPLKMRKVEARTGETWSIYLERVQVLTYFRCNQMSTQPSVLYS